MASNETVNRILVGVDDSAATDAAIDQIIRMFPGDDKPSVMLLHVIDQPAPTGFEAAASAMALDAGAMPAVPAAFSLEDAKQWQELAKKRMERFVARLSSAGWAEDRIERHAAVGGLTHAAVADALAEQAKSLDADIVVVGRTKHGTLHEALLKSTGERVVHYCRSVTVWVVGDRESCDDD